MSSLKNLLLLVHSTRGEATMTGMTGMTERLLAFSDAAIMGGERSDWESAW